MRCEEWNRAFGCRVLVRGAGDFATGIICRLILSGFKVAATELEKPLAVRRGACMSEAVYEGSYTVEGITAVKSAPDSMDHIMNEGKVAIIVDPDGAILERGFDLVVDARSAKRNLGTRIGDAPVVIAIGPGFEAGVDCHAVVETLAGGGIGRVIYRGSAAADTGVPYPLEDSACACIVDNVEKLVLRAPISGIFKIVKEIGSKAEEGELIGMISSSHQGEHAVRAGIRGVVRGVIRDGTWVEEGVKLGDIDPTMRVEHCYTISEKSRAIAGGVLEACMTLLVKKGMARK